MSHYKKILCLDFDGVLHSYTSGWKGPRTIPDPPVPGAIEWLTAFLDAHCDVPDQIAAMAPEGEFEVHIFSSRARYWGGRWAMKRWLVRHGLDRCYLQVVRFPLMKPPAYVTIDDRAICFQGTFPTVEELRSFKPWNKRRKQDRG